MTFFRFQIESSTIYIPVTSFYPKSQLDGPILGQTHPVPVPWISQFPLGFRSYPTRRRCPWAYICKSQGHPTSVALWGKLFLSAPGSDVTIAVPDMDIPTGNGDLKDLFGTYGEFKAKRNHCW